MKSFFRKLFQISLGTSKFCAKAAYFVFHAFAMSALAPLRAALFTGLTILLILLGTPIQHADAGAVTNLNTIKATGGTITTVVQNGITYKVHTFTTVGSDTFRVTSGSGKVQYLVVAGGGGGGVHNAGGGGAGGYRTNGAYNYAVSTGSYTVTVGDGGAGGTSPTADATNGNNSVFDTITATGGGGGAGGDIALAGADGGSGGGGARGNGSTTGLGGSASPAGQGNAGGKGVSSGNFGGGGGGGASAVGGDGGTNGGNGGAGTSSSISGASVCYAGGGSGGTFSSGSGGTTTCGGGAGQGASGAGPFAGTSNTGGGGGGSGNGGSSAKGGSGIVIIRYPVGVATTKSTNNTYATWNPNDKGAGVTLSNGNLTTSATSYTQTTSVRATVCKSSGKWYFEETAGAGGFSEIGVASSTVTLPANWDATGSGFFVYYQDGTKFNNSTGGVAYGASWTTNDVIGVALDADAGTLTMYKNGISQGVMTTGLLGGTPLCPVWGDGNAVTSATANFGASPFVYTPPTGYNAGFFTTPAGAGTITAMGGKISTVTSGGVTYRVHTFTSTSSPENFVVTKGGGKVWYLVVAGGGGGGGATPAGAVGGAGGAGGYLTNGAYNYPISAGTYTVTVGDGGGGGASTGIRGTAGSNSVFGAITSAGGGGGGGGKPDGTEENGGSGGSGGGATDALVSGGTGGAASPAGQGNAGGNSTQTAPNYPSGGGGGAGGAGQTNPNGSTGGNGGAGLSSSISGASVCYAGGGGGSVYGGGTGGTATCGGGAGNNNDTTPNGGTINTGGGAGGTAATGSSHAGAKGGSGIVIIRYPIGQVTANTSVTPTGLTSGLTGWWTFDGKNINWRTNTTADSSGQGNTGSLISMSTSTSPVAGKIGQALNFNGAQSVTTGKGVATLCSASLCTLSVWMYPTGTAPSATIYNSQGAVADDAGNMGIYRDNTAGVDGIWAYNWDGNADIAGVSYTPNAWTHIVMVHSGGLLSIYKNGVFASSTPSGNETGPGNFTLGRGFTSSGVYWNGGLDDVRIYNRALSPTEIKLLYNSGK